MTETKLIQPDLAVRERIEKLSGQKLSACYQCQKCSNGCPATFAMDILPHKAMRLLSLGQLDQVLKQRDHLGVLILRDLLQPLPQRHRYRPGHELPEAVPNQNQTKSAKNHNLFNQTFLSSVKRAGRLHELDMITRFTLKSQGIGGLMKERGTGLRMLKNGKLKILPPSIKSKKKVQEIFKNSAEQVDLRQEVEKADRAKNLQKRIAKAENSVGKNSELWR